MILLAVFPGHHKLPLPLISPGPALSVRHVPGLNPLSNAYIFRKIVLSDKLHLRTEE